MKNEEYKKYWKEQREEATGAPTSRTVSAGKEEPYAEHQGGTPASRSAYRRARRPNGKALYGR